MTARQRSSGKRGIGQRGGEKIERYIKGGGEGNEDNLKIGEERRKKGRTKEQDRERQEDGNNVVKWKEQYYIVIHTSIYVCVRERLKAKNETR